MEHIRQRRGGGGGEGSRAEEGRDGKVPSLSKPRRPGGGATRVGGPRGKQEARLFKLRGDGGKLSNGGANCVADGVMAENSVASSSAAQGMVTPAVEGLTTKTAGRVGIPEWHAQAALHGSADKRGGDMGVGRGRGSSEPGTGTGGAAGIEMQATGASDGSIVKKRGNGEGLDFAREGSLGGGIGLGVNAGVGSDGSSESLLSGSEAAPLVDIQGIKVRPDGGAEVAAGG